MRSPKARSGIFFRRRRRRARLRGSKIADRPAPLRARSPGPADVGVLPASRPPARAFSLCGGAQRARRAGRCPAFSADVCLMRPFRFEPRPFQRRRLPMFLYPPGEEPPFSPHPGQYRSFGPAAFKTCGGRKRRSPLWQRPKIEAGGALPAFLADVCLMRPFRFEPRPFQRRRLPMFLYPPGEEPLFSPHPGQSALSALRLLKPAAGQAAFPPTSPQMRRLRGGWQGAAPTPNSAPFI